jgi:feruloyl-CoA synthase
MGDNIYSQMPQTSVEKTEREDGSFILQAKTPLLDYGRCVGDWLERWAVERPNSVFLGERQGAQWRTLSYSQFRTQLYLLAQGIIDKGLASGQPIVILSGNSINHALLKMAAMHIGLPIASLSVAYSLADKSYDRLRDMIKRLEPAAIYVEDADVFKAAIENCGFKGQVLATENTESIDACISLRELMDVVVTNDVANRFSKVTAETHAKYMFTSGSTGQPKIVVVTQKMMCANQQMIAQYYNFIEELTPKILDWLPWSHTFGTNHNFNLVLRNGGSLYIDNGKPVPNEIHKTIENLKDVKPNIYFNVPKGYEALLEQFRNDEDLKAIFFSSLKVLFYAAAALSKPVWDELRTMSTSIGNEVFFTTEWGATETAPAITNVHWRLEKPGNIGLPLPGVQIKFVPNGSKLEMRVKGPIVFPEYLNDPEKTLSAFDDEGFYLTGDAGRLEVPSDPSKGILFDGRVAEDFKLSTGTWVCVAAIRALVHKYFGDLLSDVVVVGQDRDFITLMAFPGTKMRELAGDANLKLSFHELAQQPVVRTELTNILSEMSKTAKGSSQKVLRLLILDSPPRLDIGEVTDKGTLNQRKLLETRSDAVEALYATALSDDVIYIK